MIFENVHKKSATPNCPAMYTRYKKKKYYKKSLKTSFYKKKVVQAWYGYTAVWAKPG